MALSGRPRARSAPGSSRSPAAVLGFAEHGDLHAAIQDLGWCAAEVFKGLHVATQHRAQVLVHDCDYQTTASEFALGSRLQVVRPQRQPPLHMHRRCGCWPRNWCNWLRPKRSACSITIRPGVGHVHADLDRGGGAGADRAGLDDAGAAAQLAAALPIGLRRRGHALRRRALVVATPGMQHRCGAARHDGARGVKHVDVGRTGTGPRCLHAVMVGCLRDGIVKTARSASITTKLRGRHHPGLRPAQDRRVTPASEQA